MNIRTQAIHFHGTLQGYKVYINKRKYPRTYGEWYTFRDPERALSEALLDRKLLASVER